MFLERQIANSRVALRLMMAAGAAALMAGCADASRFADPFSNPFGGSGKTVASRDVDRTPTATIPTGPSKLMAPAHVESRPLPAPGAPAQTATASPAPAPAPVAQSAGPGGSHWTANGGTPVTVAQGETAGMIANRYGVPTDALLHANGFSTASQMQPGARIVIPVYRANAVAQSAPAAAPVASAKTTAPAQKVAEAAPAPKADPKAAIKLTKAEKAAQREEELKAERAKAAEAKAEQARKLAETKAQKAADAKIAADKAKLAKDQKAADAKVAADKAKLAKDQKAADAKAAAEKAKLAKAEKAAAKAAEAAKAETAKAEAAKAEVAKAEAAKAEKPAAKVAEKQAEPAKGVDKTPTAAIPPAAAAEEKAASAGADRPEFRWPAHGRIIQGFASGNDGINIAVPEGTQVKAAEGGVVAYAGSELKGYGNLVLIRHPNGYVTAYANNSALEVKRGDQVKRGQTIAKSGQSGNVGSPQLHFELRKGSTPVDPTNFLAGL